MFKQIIGALALSLVMALPAFAASAVNVNTADARTIAASLDGVGMRKAAAIVAYRNAHGPYKNLDEVAKVKGIGAKTVARNHGAIHLDGSFAPPTKPARKTRHHKAPKKA